MKRLLLIFATLLASCAGPGITQMRAGADEAEVRQLWGEPTSRYSMPSGTRLEYATGPFGVTTWMVDLDKAGHATEWRQVLDSRNLHGIQGRLPGMTSDALLRELGRPGERRGGGRQGGEVWSWRFENSFCEWFQVSVGKDDIVRDGIFTLDPLCERKFQR